MTISALKKIQMRLWTQNCLLYDEQISCILLNTDQGYVQICANGTPQIVSISAPSVCVLNINQTFHFVSCLTPALCMASGDLIEIIGLNMNLIEQEQSVFNMHVKKFHDVATISAQFNILNEMSQLL